MIIGRLTGTVSAEEPNGTVLVEVGGVGYEVMTPLGTLGRAPSDGAQVTLHVHTHVSEKSISLYGFASTDDKLVFRLLLTVQNLGPKTAVAVLGELPAPELIRAIADKDVTRLNAVSGIGKRTAERLVLELREKLPKLQLSGSAGGEAPPDNAVRVISALTNMGYRPGEAERAVAQLGDGAKKLPVAELLKEALAALAP